MPPKGMTLKHGHGTQIGSQQGGQGPARMSLPLDAPGEKGPYFVLGVGPNYGPMFWAWDQNNVSNTGSQIWGWFGPLVPSTVWPRSQGLVSQRESSLHISVAEVNSCSKALQQGCADTY